VKFSLRCVQFMQFAEKVLINVDCKLIVLVANVICNVCIYLLICSLFNYAISVALTQTV
jgi:hypothetical protein